MKRKSEVISPDQTPAHASSAAYISQKLSGQVTFGVEDPYLMGQIFEVWRLLYPVYGKKIDLTPVMDANALDGELSFRAESVGVLALMALPDLDG